MPRRNPAVLAYHLVWTAYGTWLPNDPRGSRSHNVATDILSGLGEIHFGRKRTQPKPAVVRAFYERAKPLLDHPTIHFDASQRETIATGFADAITQQNYTCWACAILPDHVHLVIRKHRDRAEEMIFTLQEASRLRLRSARLMPRNHPVWTSGGWKSFLDSREAVRAAIRYVERNPAKSGLAAQNWDFVIPYDGWSLAN